jgi:hypothetical protein
MPWAGLARRRVLVGTKWPLTQARVRMRPKAGAFASTVHVSLRNRHYSLAGINPVDTIVSWTIDPDAPPNAMAAAVSMPLDLLVG